MVFIHFELSSEDIRLSSRFTSEDRDQSYIICIIGHVSRRTAGQNPTVEGNTGTGDGLRTYSNRVAAVQGYSFAGGRYCAAGGCLIDHEDLSFIGNSVVVIVYSPLCLKFGVFVEG